VAERWIDRATARQPELALVSGRCLYGHDRPGRELNRGFDYEYHTARNEFRGTVCPDCDVWFLDPRPSERDFPVIYPDTYSSYATDSASGSGLAFRAKAVLEALKIRRYARFVRQLEGDVLDVGCGDGMLLDGFARAGFPRESLVGVDFNPRAVAAARAKGYRVFEDLFERADLGAGRYRLIVMNQLIEHLVDPLGALVKLRRLLCRGGHVFLETPNRAAPNARVARRRCWGGYHYPRHLHLFAPRTISAALEQADLEVVDIRFIPCPVQWAVTFNSWLQERRRPPGLLLRLTDWHNPLTLALFTLLDLVLLPLGTANMQVVAARPSGSAQ